MTTCTVIVNKVFETEAAALLVQNASRFNSKIYLQIMNKNANAKSIMGVISLDLAAGQEIIITAEGGDEQQAIDALRDFFTAAVNT